MKIAFRLHVWVCLRMSARSENQQKVCLSESEEEGEKYKQFRMHAETNINLHEFNKKLQ